MLVHNCCTCFVYTHILTTFLHSPLVIVVLLPSVFYTISDSNDYIGVSTVFTFSESSEQCENVMIIDDDIPESCESFSVDVSTDTESAVFSESSRTVTILDNEGCYTIHDTHH